MKKRKKALLSIVLAFTLVFLSSFPILAAENNDKLSEVLPEDKISDTLNEIIGKTENNERISVFVWYQDINQDELDENVFQKIGLDLKKCDAIPSMSISDVEDKPSTDLEYLSEYFDFTEPQRKKEDELVTEYNMTRRSLASEEYAAKSQKLIDDTVLNEDRIRFNSSLAPMIIADLTTDEIIALSENSLVESISFNYETRIDEFQIELDRYSNYDFPFRDPEMVFDSIGLTDFYNSFNIDGSGVKIGLVEGNVPGIQIDDSNTYSVFGFSSDNLLQLTYDQFADFSSIDTIVENAVNNFSSTGPLKVIDLVETGNSAFLSPDAPGIDKHSHANNSVSVMSGDIIGIAKGAQIYASLVGQGDLSDADYIKFANTEALVKCGINILITNIEVHTNFDFTIDYINNEIKYNEHLVYAHNVTVVMPGGNDCYDPVYQNPNWLSLAALPYNAITVSGYDVTCEEGEFTETRLNYKWQNSDTNLNMYACEKPDMIYPGCYAAGGTSVAAPAMAATIALMMEMNPILKLQPQAVKSIILASCHRKADPATSTEAQETMTSGIPGRERTGSQSGITEMQGAGIPDVMKIAEIICQHTYGVDTIASSDKTINIIQPSYGANSINFSLSWLRGTTAINDHLFENEITLHNAYDLQLNIINNNSISAKSDLLYSSTELCYVPVSSTVQPYGINVTRASSGDVVKFGYAWSTDSRNNMSLSKDGIYYIRNYYSGKYLMYDNDQNNSYLQAKIDSVSDQYALNQDNYRWIVDSYLNGYTICNGIGSTPKYLNISNIESNNRWYTDVSSIKYQIDFVENKDGTYSIFNYDHSKVLYGKNSATFWSPYDGVREIKTQEKWYLDRNNYLLMDANANGGIDGLDYAFLFSVLFGNSTPTNIQRFLGDVNNSGYLDGYDLFLLNNYLLYSNS